MFISQQITTCISTNWRLTEHVMVIQNTTSACNSSNKFYNKKVSSCFKKKNVIKQLFVESVVALTSNIDELLIEQFGLFGNYTSYPRNNQV